MPELQTQIAKYCPQVGQSTREMGGERNATKRATR
jgi:hypothetical protein